MKKFSLSAAVIIAFILYGLHQRSEEVALPAVVPKQTSTATVSPAPSTPLAPAPSDTSTASSTVDQPVSAPAPSATPTPSGKYKNGTYTGLVADAYYGNIQVQATVQGGKLTGVTFLQYPNDRSTSVRINSQAMPYLQQEAIQAQSAQVDGVSGASDTSQAFRESLADALSQAQ